MRKERRRVSHPVGGPRVTDGSQAEACDVNTIVKQFTRTGLLPQRQGARYEDVSSLDYMEMRNFLADREALFRGLPARVRARFGGDYYQLLRWLENPENREEAVKLGLVQAAKAEQTDLLKPPGAPKPAGEPGEGFEEPFEPEEDMPVSDEEAQPRGRKATPPKGGRK